MDISRLIGHAKISFHHHPNPISLLSKQKGKEVAQTLLEIARATTPPCNLNPFLFNGHLQTAYTAITPYDVPVYYKRHVFSAEDPAFTGTFAVDFAVPAYSECNDLLPPRTTYYKDAEFEGIKSMDSKPMLVTLHGLSGGSHEIYLRHCLKPLLDSGEWEACVVNSRGCARSQITSSVLYNARATWDVRQTVKWLRGTFPNRPLFGIGFSLGANILTNVRILSIDIIILLFPGTLDLMFRVVSRRGRIGLLAESCCNLFKSVEPRSWLVGAAAKLAWA